MQLESQARKTLSVPPKQWRCTAKATSQSHRNNYKSLNFSCLPLVGCPKREIGCQSGSKKTTPLSEIYCACTGELTRKTRLVRAWRPSSLTGDDLRTRDPLGCVPSIDDQLRFLNDPGIVVIGVVG